MPKNENERGSRSVTIVVTPNDLRTAQWLLETYRQHGIDPARGTKFLTAHFRATAAGRSFSAIRREYVALWEHQGTGHSQVRHCRCSLRDFTRMLTPHDKANYCRRQLFFELISLTPRRVRLWSVLTRRHFEERTNATGERFFHLHIHLTQVTQIGRNSPVATLIAPSASAREPGAMRTE
jgi:hypothetical protein